MLVTEKELIYYEHILIIKLCIEYTKERYLFNNETFNVYDRVTERTLVGLTAVILFFNSCTMFELGYVFVVLYPYIV